MISDRICFGGRFQDKYPEWTERTHPSSKDVDYYSPLYRPALLPEDAQHSPTREALRFGINPGADKPGRSMMTPISDHPAGRDPGLDEMEEEYQAYVLRGFTTSELVETGSYVPDVSPGFPTPDLPPNVLSPFLSQDKWLASPDGTAEKDPRLFYGLESNVEFNIQSIEGQKVWTAILPSLLIATRVLRVHPFWEAMLDICKYRYERKEYPRVLLERIYLEALHWTALAGNSVSLQALRQHLTINRPPPASAQKFRLSYRSAVRPR